MNRLVIIGSGFSAVCFLENLVRNNKINKYQIVLFEKESNLVGTGIPYQNVYNRSDKLNVKANQMGINSQNEESFFQWLHINGYKVEPEQFVERKLYGDYLNFIFSQFKNKIQIVNEEVISIDESYVYLNENKIEYDQVVILTGMNPRKSVNLNTLILQNEIKIKGSGLSAIDQVIELKKLNYKGEIHLFSRRGIFPLAHSAKTLNLEKLPSKLVELFALIKNNPEEMLSVIRKNINELWNNFTIKEKRQFVKYLRPYWEYFRHRTPAEHLQKMYQMMEENVLFIHRVDKNSNLEYDIDCSGLNPFDNLLVKNLLNNKILYYDELKIGVEVPEKYLGKIFITPSLQRHKNFEMTAVRELRMEMEKLALSF